MSDNWENWKSPVRDIRGMTWSPVRKMKLTAESNLMLIFIIKAVHKKLWVIIC